MAARDMNQWETAICEVVSSEDEEEVIVRGHRLSELIGSVSFAEAMFLLLSGRLPSKPEGRVLDALLVAAIEHGIAPPSMIARCLASYGSPLQAAVAGGVLAFGDSMGGAGEQFAKLLFDRLPTPAPETETEADLRAIAGAIIDEARATNARIPGYGIPLHGMDPRAPKLLGIARDEGVYGRHCRLAAAIETEIAARTGRAIPMNLDGVGACLTLDLGFPWQSARLFIITPRTVSMGAHYLEELDQNTLWRHIPKTQIDYQG